MLPYHIGFVSVLRLPSNIKRRDNKLVRNSDSKRVVRLILEVSSGTAFWTTPNLFRSIRHLFTEFGQRQLHNAASDTLDFVPARLCVSWRAAIVRSSWGTESRTLRRHRFLHVNSWTAVNSQEKLRRLLGSEPRALAGFTDRIVARF